jgi:putative redox protein
MAQPSDFREWVLVEGPASGFAQQVSVGPHRLHSDEPVDAGGTDTGPSPYDLLLAALGSCTSMTIASFARRRQWPLEHVTVRMRHSRIYADDCADCEVKNVRIDRIEREIGLKGDLSDVQRNALLAIAEKCPVHRTLTSEIRMIPPSVIRARGSARGRSGGPSRLRLAMERVRDRLHDAVGAVIRCAGAGA